MKITDEAVEAAFLKLYDSAYVGGVTRLDVRRSLEAAAPHMLPAPLDPEFALEVATENYRQWLDEQDNP